jgi:V-type H+-transporting ATPase subunit a
MYNCVAWCPTNALSTVQYALHSVSDRSGSMVPPVLNELKTTLTPPTYHKTNKFTKGFQAIVDAYGVAKYKEVNPGLFTLITFPFLFAVMFGDLGHGIIVFAAGLYMCLRERQLDKPGMGEIFRTFFGGRYIILLMGLFAIYVGLIYNDAFSLPMVLAPSAYVRQPNGKLMKIDGVTYPFGIDWNWRLCENSLLFLNSYKMKMSIIIGVIHMTFGICLTVYNSTYFKKKMNIYCEFIPQILFLQCLFGYLAVLIIYKWLTYWPNSKAPQLLETLIFMFLSPGQVSPGNQLYPGQVISFLQQNERLCVVTNYYTIRRLFK